MQVEKQQLELDMEKQTGSKSGKEYIKAVYYPAYLTYMQSDVCAEYVHSHSNDGARGEARSRRFCRHSHWVIDGIRVPCPCEQLLGRNMQLLLSQRKQSSLTYFT